MSIATLERPRATVPFVGTGDVGDQIRMRRMALGLSVKALAERANVDRGRLAAIEDGAGARSGTLGAINAALDVLEEEMSGPYDTEAGGGTVRFRLHGNFGVDVTVQGPVDNIDELRDSAEKLLEKMLIERGQSES